jgi:hypothetical protein
MQLYLTHGDGLYLASDVHPKILQKLLNDLIGTFIGASTHPPLLR